MDREVTCNHHLFIISIRGLQNAINPAELSRADPSIKLDKSSFGKIYNTKKEKKLP